MDSSLLGCWRRYVRLWATSISEVVTGEVAKAERKLENKACATLVSAANQKIFMIGGGSRQ